MTGKRNSCCLARDVTACEVAAGGESATAAARKVCQLEFRLVLRGARLLLLFASQVECAHQKSGVTSDERPSE